MELKFPFECVENTPVFWLKSISFFSEPSLSGHIRTITFSRGLNIIWGKELDENPEDLHPILLSGHSVGKTTLCRMIRYCLGEEHFSSPAAENLIKTKFPNGLAVLELQLDNENWIIIRKFSKPSSSFAVNDSIINNCFANWDNLDDESFKIFIGKLDQNSTSKWPSKNTPDGKVNITWQDLISWMTRDQEARFQSLWEWRSARSGSGIQQLNREHAEYLMRLVLDLIHEKDVKLSEEILNDQNELELKKKEKDALVDKYKRNLSDYERRIIELVGGENSDYQTDGTLFSVEQAIENQKSTIENEIQSLQIKNDALTKAIDHSNLVISRYEEEIEFLLSVMKTVDFDKNESSEENSKKVEKYIKKFCPAGNIYIRDCDYYKEYFANLLKEEKKLRLHYNDPTDEQRKIAILSKNKEISDKRDAAEEFKKINDSKQEERTEQYTILSDLKNKLNTLNNLYPEYVRLKDRIKLGLDDNAVSQIVKRIDFLEKAIEEKKNELKNNNNKDYENKKNALQKTYNWLIQKVLSDIYTGVIKLTPSEFRFDIHERSGLSGEAVGSLSHVLADLTAILYSIQGIGSHPRFLIHDSPREADLDRHIYNHFLQIVYEISEKMGGANSAPFQYIVTTTSRPPEALLKRNVVKAEISAQSEKNLLLCCRLGEMQVQQIELGLS